jgi:pimeloyl-ACP methyl ester carboxylesterase
MSRAIHPEETLVLGESAHLVATLTTPAQAGDQPPPIIALLSNSGVIPRSGPNRMNVHLARRFAELGIPSVRFDLSGLGDSSRPATPKPMMAQWLEDCRAVMDHAEQRHGCSRFLMIGFCSGAEVAHLLGLQDPRLRAALLWDMYAYPTLGSKLHFLAYRLRKLGVAGLASKVSDRILRALRLRPTPVSAKAVNPPAIPSQPPDKGELMQRLQTLVDQGVSLHFSFAEGNPHWFNHDGQFWAMFKGAPFVKHVSFRFLREADHLLTEAHAQRAFLDMTDDWLQKRVLPALDTGAAPKRP